MEIAFESIQKFNLSSECIFSFKSMDYPTPLQQRMIFSYYELKEVMRNQHNDIVRYFHSANQKQLDSIIHGIVYFVLHDHSTAQYLFENYMTILRNQAWITMNRILTQIIKQTFVFIKNQYRLSLNILLGRLFFFGQLSNELLITSLKTIDIFDLSEDSLNYNNSIAELFYRFILKYSVQNKQIMQIFCLLMFFKILRMITIINLVEDTAMREYKYKCITIAEKLFQYDRQKCLATGWEVLRLLKELQKQEALDHIITEAKQHLMTHKNFYTSHQDLRIILGTVLPIRIESVLLFILQKKVDKVEINVQLSWIFNNTSTQQHFELMVVDILKYLLVIPKQQFRGQHIIYILEWLLYRCCTNNILYEYWKAELFNSWFYNQNSSPRAVQISVSFLNYILVNNFQFGQNLLLYLLRNMHDKNYCRKLRQILQRAHESKILNLDWLVKHVNLNERTKYELKIVMQEQVDLRDVEMNNNMESLYYDPLQSLTQNQPQAEFSDEEDHIYQDLEDISRNQNNQNNLLNEQITQQQEIVYQIKLQKQFVEDISDPLVKLLAEPIIINYKQFYKKLHLECKNHKINNENEVIESFIIETAKLTYLLFQSEFQNYQQVSSQETTIHYLLYLVTTEWKNNNHTTQIIKKTIKKIIELFPTAEPAFWRYFLQYFKRGATPNAKDVKDWLIVKEKTEYVIPLLRQLMHQKLTKQIIDNADSLRIPL